MKRIRTGRVDSGWTFVESIIVIAIVIILTGTVAFSAARYVGRARAASTRAQIAALTIALHAYFMDCGRYPSEGQGLDALWERPGLAPVPDGWNGPYVERRVVRDGWGNAFDYRTPGPGGLAFEIVSTGADGFPGGSGDDADISSAR
ncbi:MAG: type II secretion system major pseudopilin GspG [Spirochaetota bacterium]